MKESWRNQTTEDIELILKNKWGWAFTKNTELEPLLIELWTQNCMDKVREIGPHFPIKKVADDSEYSTFNGT